MQRFYEELEVGDQVGPQELIISSQQVTAYMGAWSQRGGDDRFVSDEFARERGLPGAMVPGAMTMSHLSRLITDLSDSLNLKLLDVIFRQPVLHNLPITLHGMVTDKRVEDGVGTIEADLYADSEEYGRHITGRAVFTLPLRAA
jgi:acyl dehydratase